MTTRTFTRTVGALLGVLDKAGLPPPGILERRDHEIVALYPDRKLAVIVELDDESDDLDDGLDDGLDEDDEFDDAAHEDDDPSAVAEA